MIRENINYSFTGLTAFDIEAEPGTTLKIGKYADGHEAITVKVGEAGRYTLSPMDDMVNYIMFESPTFAIVNYKCLTT